MSIKRISMFLLAAVVVGSASLSIYENKNSGAGTKNVVVTAQSNNINKNNTISDEKAVQMAIKAMKDYMGVDAASRFSGTEIHRTEANEYKQIEDAAEDTIKKYPSYEKKVEYAKKQLEWVKHSDYYIYVNFMSNDGTYFVAIDENTGEVVNVTLISREDTSGTYKVDDGKVKSAALSYLKKIGKDSCVDLNSISIDNGNGPLTTVTFNIKNKTGNSKRDVIVLEASLKNYNIIHYQDYSNSYNK
ncbi:putative small secreted protein [Clostridium acetobutylicum]|uniref:PepSY domain-containing protein n=1 Tax=Clostridium acetobutylicum (strain ATCC 824 / DSM 792 / JCM 1419 / IAM 19013 / LMG 5710 / NBRC 13948 / NRRL B-527 / VKM B-1787 / 2291 / W) TaxID=272562 RepID=Q97IY2_CLOAB|nr:MULTISPECIES: hypothetical protein [Clostridium]AAK79472.1 Hypothetical protein CA_C1505 [Clostridium acetobutylicum ATCC 824]ADZ20557.1 Conserved hypothetical protein [Clostridium acetobutylicum EA 2018]AEI31846.1 hypothetical protein SMB_G1530 [Clostridium acetobutylicum DSM 1731]AWV81283.1 hypothetical protein DK921_14520 [Clostridium acetobutylicum]MBC2392917.1 hypothetical protein [Clostridium acetobutylicum]